MGDGRGGVEEPQAGAQMEGVLLAPSCSYGTGGVRGGHGDGSPDSGYGGATHRHQGRAGGSIGPAAEDEENEGGGSHTTEVTALPAALTLPAQPRSLCRGGLWFSPVGNRFWLLDGDDSNNEAGYSSYLDCKYRSPSKYLHSPLRFSITRIARSSKNEESY